MIYFIVTTSLFENDQKRINQYITGITSLKQAIQKRNIQNYKIIIVENNGERYTLLNTLDCDVFYTTNNFTHLEKGNKELQDVRDCISKYNMSDYDFIVKMTGRYIIREISEFMDILSLMSSNNKNYLYDCIIRYGCCHNKINYKTNDCITGLIGMRVKYVKLVQMTNNYSQCIEWKWAEATYHIEYNKIYIVNELGLIIDPFDGSARLYV